MNKGRKKRGRSEREVTKVQHRERMKVTWMQTVSRQVASEQTCNASVLVVSCLLHFSCLSRLISCLFIQHQCVYVTNAICMWVTTFDLALVMHLINTWVSESSWGVKQNMPSLCISFSSYSLVCCNQQIIIIMAMETESLVIVLRDLSSSCFWQGCKNEPERERRREERSEKRRKQEEKKRKKKKKKRREDGIACGKLRLAVSLPWEQLQVKMKVVVLFFSSSSLPVVVHFIININSQWVDWLFALYSWCLWWGGSEAANKE